MPDGRDLSWNLRWRVASALALVLATGLRFDLRAAAAQAADSTGGSAATQAVLQFRCVKCHGPLKPKADLNLSTLRGIARGSGGGKVVVPGKPDDSLLWQQIESDEMPPENPLSAQEKETLRQWIQDGASGLPQGDLGERVGFDHWAFQKLSPQQPPNVRDGTRVRTDVDRFVQARLEQCGLSLGPDADRDTLIRRVAFDLTGLPPTLAEIEQFQADTTADAYERLVDRYLASPRYGEHWGQYWLDAAGYADSSGYFTNERDRPLAWRYRDYVVQAFNRDKPFDEFVQEQLAGDELANYRPGELASPRQIEQLVATHFLRNAPDGTDQSAASPDAMQIDRYAALEGTQQIVASSLLALSVKCARCHDHKLEPISQKEFYQLQAVLVPAMNPVRWTAPLARTIRAPLAEEREIWLAKLADTESRIAALHDKLKELATSLEVHRQHGAELLSANFDTPESGELTVCRQFPAVTPLALNNAQPTGGAAQGGSRIEAGALAVIAGDDRAFLRTKQSFDWTPEHVGDWIQATFQLVNDRIPPEGRPTNRVSYYIAFLEQDGSKPSERGNLLVQGNLDGPINAFFDAPLGSPRAIGTFGRDAYIPGKHYGLRVTNVGGGKFRVDHMVDFCADPSNLVVDAADLPDGSFAFYQGGGYSFVVDNLIVEAGRATSGESGQGGQKLFSDLAGGAVDTLWNSIQFTAANLPEAAALVDMEQTSRHCAARHGTRLALNATNVSEATLSTRASFDWTPDAPGESIEVTFDLVSDVSSVKGAVIPPASHFGFYVALRGAAAVGPESAGGVLIDGCADGPPQAYIHYPSEPRRKISFGHSPYKVGGNYGVRVTNIGDGNFKLEHLIDGIAEPESLALTTADLPDGGFGFYLAAARCFSVDRVTIATAKLPPAASAAAADNTFATVRGLIRQTVVELKQTEDERHTPYGTEIAWVSDAGPELPEVFILKRGDYKQRGDAVEPGGLVALTDADNTFSLAPPAGDARTTGRRLAFARWLTKPASRAAALMARVQINRLWLNHFGQGFTSTPDNLGLSGAAPDDPELLDFLASRWVESGWHWKPLQRLILVSSVYRQTGFAHAAGLAVDPGNRRLWRFPLRRLSAEAIRDAMLAASGELDLNGGGPFVPIDRHGSEFEVQRGSLNREIVVAEKTPGAQRRSIYLEHRRAQLPTFLALFGTPSLTLNCVARPAGTVPLQSLAQLNSEFAQLRSLAMARRLTLEAGADSGAQVERAYRIAFGRAPSTEEREEARQFVADQQALYPTDQSIQALADFCHMLLSSSPFLYIE